MLMIQQHLVDIIVGAIVVVLLALAIHHVVKHPGCSCGKKDGCSCGGSCSSCSDPVDFAKMKEAVDGTHSK